MPKLRSGVYYPRKGSAEAKEWGRRMQEARRRKRGRKGASRGRKNPGARWHLRHAHIARDMEDAAKGSGKLYYRGMGRAHITSAAVADAIGENPRRRRRKRVARRVIRRRPRRARRNPIVVANPTRGGVVLYRGNIEIRGRRALGKFRGKLFKHAYRPKSDVVIVGLKDGTVLLRSLTGSPLWGYLPD